MATRKRCWKLFRTSDTKEETPRQVRKVCLKLPEPVFKKKKCPVKLLSVLELSTAAAHMLSYCVIVVFRAR